MKITLNRFLIFVSVILLAGLSLQQCWQRKPDAEKWLYLFDEPARDYAGRVLGPDRGTGLELPEALSDMTVRVNEQEGYVVFSSTMFSGEDGKPMDMAFAVGGPPPRPEDRPGFDWVHVRESWYLLRPAP
jgi:hypothetical protein